MSTLSTSDRSSAILSRIIRADNGDFSKAAAEAILSFRLPDDDRERVNELAAGARAGTLTEEDRAELDDYERVTALIETLQSKARRSLQGSSQSA